MARIEEQIDIAASSPSVFSFCHDPAKRPQWDERVLRVEVLTASPVRQGTLIRVDAGRSGRFLFSWDGEYASYRYPQGSTVQVLDAAPSSPFKSGSEKWQFSSSGDGTRLNLVWDYRPRGFIASIIDGLWGRASTRRAIRCSLANLKRLIEAG